MTAQEEELLELELLESEEEAVSGSPLPSLLQERAWDGKWLGRGHSGAEG